MYNQLALSANTTIHVNSGKLNVELSKSVYGAPKSFDFSLPKKAPPQSVKLNNGLSMPLLGLGTYKCAPGEVTQAVQDAISLGYRYIDCAMKYENEKEVGAAITAKIRDGTVKREDLFITSKIWCNTHSQGSVVPTLKKTLKDLGISYVDMYLIHWPMGLEEGGELIPKNADGSVAFSDIDYVETWRGLEEAVQLGLTKSIGVSNFNSEQVQRILDMARIVPATNQVEVSPYFANTKLVEFCQSRGIVVTGYSPLGGSAQPGGKPKILEEKVIRDLAAFYGKSAVQIVLRWSVQRNISTIPKSVHKDRIRLNKNIFDFTLSPEAMARINELDTNVRGFPLAAYKDHDYYPFKIPF